MPQRAAKAAANRISRRWPVSLARFAGKTGNDCLAIAIAAKSHCGRSHERQPYKNIAVAMTLPRKRRNNLRFGTDTVVC